MKQDLKFDHSKTPMENLGTTMERVEQINKFCDDMLTETIEKDLEKTKVMERIIDFAETTTEAVIIGMFFGTRLEQESNSIDPMVMMSHILRGGAQKKSRKQKPQAEA